MPPLAGAPLERYQGRAETRVATEALRLQRSPTTEPHSPSKLPLLGLCERSPSETSRQPARHPGPPARRAGRIGTTFVAEHKSKTHHCTSYSINAHPRGNPQLDALANRRKPRRRWIGRGRYPARVARTRSHRAFRWLGVPARRALRVPSGWRVRSPQCLRRCIPVAAGAALTAACSAHGGCSDILCESASARGGCLASCAPCRRGFLALPARQLPGRRTVPTLQARVCFMAAILGHAPGRCFRRYPDRRSNCGELPSPLDPPGTSVFTLSRMALLRVWRRRRDAECALAVPESQVFHSHDEGRV